MTLSKYIIKIPKEDDIIIFSTISKAVVVLSRAEVEMLSFGKCPQTFSKSDLEKLKELDIVVDDEIDEKDKVWVELTSDRLHPHVFSSYVALATDCNFACVYCYEKGQVSNIASTITNELMSEIIKWYSFIIKEREYSRIHICLYGGEPLLHKDLLMDFVNRIKKLSLDRRISPPSFSMITNGYLIDEKTLSYLCKSGLEEIQITLDGDEGAHNSRRYLASGEGTFKVIIQNIKLLQRLFPKLRILIRISFDDTNKNNIASLLDFLKLEGISKGITIYFAPIHQTKTQNTDKCSFCSNAVYCDEKIIETYKDLYNCAYEKGYKIPYCHTEGICMINGRDSVLIAPDGKLYKCVEMIDEKEQCIGNVIDGYNAIYYKFIRGTKLEECIKSGCKYVALCGGGCEKVRILEKEHGNINQCKRKYFDELLPFFLSKIKI